MKKAGFVDPECQFTDIMLCIRNLKIVNQYAKMRAIGPENLFGKSEYEWLQENVINFDQYENDAKTELDQYGIRPMPIKLKK